MDGVLMSSGLATILPGRNSQVPGGDLDMTVSRDMIDLLLRRKPQAFISFTSKGRR